MNSDIFEDIEQDNNPSFYGNQSFLSDGKNKSNGNAKDNSFNNSIINDDNDDQISSKNYRNMDLVNNSLGLSNKIRNFLHDDNLSIDVISSERLMNSSIIVYSIEISIDSSNSIIVKRRYSEFKSFRDNLLKLFPTLIIPPIPEKHTIFNYLINSINNSKESTIIETRKRNFKVFLIDLIFNSNPILKDCPLLHKFLDPNYELCWNNAINEPPLNLLPNNLLLANPINPTDQNGLYSLLPIVNGFEFNSQIDNLHSLKKINDDLHKLNDQINLFKIKEEDDNLKILNNSSISNTNNEFISFKDIPIELISYEIIFHQNIKILNELNKLNNKSIKNYKSVINNLIELGGNLNNFSLQIHELSDLNNHSNFNNQLSSLIEKFGSTIDLNFLNFESFVISNLIPNWQEPINQLIQYYSTALQLIKFYKFKLIQFKLLFKLKFNKIQDLMTFNNNYQNHIKLNDLKNLNINSPSINDAIKRIELKQKKLSTNSRSLNSKKSWYGLFGGNKSSFILPDDDTFQQYNSHQNNQLQSKDTYNNYTSPTSSPQKPISKPDPLADLPPNDLSNQFLYKIHQIEKELTKLDQLINLVNKDMIDLTDHLKSTFSSFSTSMEKKWLTIMLEFIRSGKDLFSENLANWNDLKAFIDN